jgi:hypothetical protein
MPPKAQKQPRGPKGQFISRKSLTNLSDTSSLNTSAESSPLDTPEVRSRELAQNSSDREDSEYESLEVQQQLDQNNDEDTESLKGAPDPERTTLPTFETQPVQTLIPRPSQQTQTAIQPWPIASIGSAKALTSHVLIKTQSVSNQTKPLIRNPAPLLSPPKKTIAMSNNTPNWFHGRPDENAQNFLKEVERYILFSDLKTEGGKITVFSTLLSAGSIADTWWNKLDSTQKTTWVDVKKSFTARWPGIAIAEKTGLDYQREILALRLTDEELGTQITVAGVPTWSHLQYRASLHQLVNEAGAATIAGLVYQVRENLPVVMKELTTPGVADWDKFLEEIEKIDTNKLREKAEAARKKKDVEKAQNARLTRLENMQTDAIEVMRLQLQHTGIGNAQTNQAYTNTPNRAPSDNSSPRIRYVTKGQPQSTQQGYRQRQPLTPEEKNLL